MTNESGRQRLEWPFADIFDRSFYSDDWSILVRPDSIWWGLDHMPEFTRATMSFRGELKPVPNDGSQYVIILESHGERIEELRRWRKPSQIQLDLPDRVFAEVTETEDRVLVHLLNFVGEKERITGTILCRSSVGKAMKLWQPELEDPVAVEGQTKEQGIVFHLEERFTYAVCEIDKN